MKLAKPILLLFGLNILDAVFTIAEVRNGFATESNSLMGMFLDMGNGPFLAVKIGMGLFAAAVLYYGAQYPLARYGLGLALLTYVGTMGVHLFTGLAVYGYLS